MLTEGTEGKLPSCARREPCRDPKKREKRQRTRQRTQRTTMEGKLRAVTGGTKTWGLQILGFGGESMIWFSQWEIQYDYDWGIDYRWNKQQQLEMDPTAITMAKYKEEVGWKEQV